MDDEKMYEIVCKGKFDELNRKMDIMTDLLKGKNGGTGMVGDVQQLKKVNKWVFGAVIFVFSTGTVQLVHWIFITWIFSKL